MDLCPVEATVDTTHSQRTYLLHEPQQSDPLPSNQPGITEESSINPTAPINSFAQRRREGSIRVYYQNVRGLRTKIKDLFLAALDAEYDIIVYTETWLNDEINSAQLFGEKYTVYRNDRNTITTGKKRGGGVLIGVSNKISSSESTSTVDDSVEHIWVNVYVAKVTIAIGAVYIAPELATEVNCIEKFLESAFKITESLKPCDCHLLLGDYNQPNLVWTSSFNGFMYPDPSKSSFSPSSSCLVDGMAAMDMKQTNVVKNSRDRFLDLVFINAEFVSRCMVSEAVEPLLPTDSFHPALVVDLHSLPSYIFDNATDDLKFNFHKADFDALSREIACVNWTQLLDGDIDEGVAAFTSHLSQLFCRFVPAPQPRRKPPWSNHHLRELKRIRAATLRRYTNSRNPFEKREFTIASNNYRTLNRYLYSRYIQHKESDLRRNPKSFWKFMNEKRKTNGLPTTMFHDSKVAESRSAICNLFADHFSHVFAADTADEHSINMALRFVPNDVIDVRNISFSVEDVLSAIKKLKPSVATGPDGIPAIVLKKCANSIAIPLAEIFNKSLSQAKFPTLWKESVMFPIHKKGEKRDVTNYRGITSLCAGSKLLEILVGDILFGAVKSYISPAQHGFFRERSIETNLVEFVSLCLKAMENGAQIDTVYTDLKAAFDRVDHQLLLAKIHRLGASSHFVGWLESYLINRTLRIKIGSSQSYSFTNQSGVPQGSNLGPLLFSIFFNDICLLIPPDCKLVYADDLKIFIVVKSIEDCRELQRLIQLFEDWCFWNQLIISVQKCCVISFSRKRFTHDWTYEICGSPVERVSVVKDLGVLLDSQLSFRHHYSSIIARANRNLGFIRRASSGFRDPYCLRSLFYALVRSVLESASIVWSPYVDCWISRIEAIQSKFIKFALRLLPWNNPTSLPPYQERCRLLGMETLQQRRHSARAIFVAKLLLGCIDSPQLLGQINLNVPALSLRSREFLRISFRRTDYGKNEPIQAMCKEFNEVYHVFKFTRSVVDFKNRLKLLNLSV